METVQESAVGGGENKVRTMSVRAEMASLLVESE